jgi:hypothetical protein
MLKLCQLVDKRLHKSFDLVPSAVKGVSGPWAPSSAFSAHMSMAIPGVAIWPIMPICM